jgi:hypothetical protein
MKRGSRKTADELRPEYRRSDFGSLVRGKYAARVATETNIVVLEPEIAEAFPNAKAVNDALRGLLDVATSNTSLNRTSQKTARTSCVALAHREQARSTRLFMETMGRK